MKANYLNVNILHSSILKIMLLIQLKNVKAGF